MQIDDVVGVRYFAACTQDCTQLMHQRLPGVQQRGIVSQCHHVLGESQTVMKVVGEKTDFRVLLVELPSLCVADGLQLADQLTTFQIDLTDQT